MKPATVGLGTALAVILAAVSGAFPRAGCAQCRESARGSLLSRSMLAPGPGNSLVMGNPLAPTGRSFNVGSAVSPGAFAARGPAWDPDCAPSRGALLAAAQLAASPFVSLDGQRQLLTAFQGRVVLLVFGDARSSAFGAMVDQLESGWQTFADQGLVVVTAFRASSEEDAAAVARFQQEHGLTFPVLLDLNGRAGSACRITRYPTCLLMDRNGRVQQVQRGFDADQLERILARLEPGFAQRLAQLDAQPAPRLSAGAELVR
jgi:hypothetical protein